MSVALSPSLIPSRKSHRAILTFCSHNIGTNFSIFSSFSNKPLSKFQLQSKQTISLTSNLLSSHSSSLSLTNLRKFSSRKDYERFQCIRMDVQVEQEASGTSTFIKDVAKLDPPSNLPTLIKLLQAKGEKLLSPNEREGIIPLAIPLSKNEKNGNLTALLRWPTAPEGMEIPVVTVEKFGIKLLAKSVDSYIHRILVEEEFSNGRQNFEKEEKNISFADVAGEEGKKIYPPGTMSSSGIADLNVYLMKKVGMFPDVFERLSLNHLEKGDVVSALVTGEFYATRKHFPGFGRPYVFNSELLTKLGRKNEAKDYAKISLKCPWWTLGASFQEVSEIACIGETFLEFAKEKVSAEGEKEDLVKGKLPEQIALDQAAFLLDICSVENSWDENRLSLADLYEKGGLPDFAKFVRSVPNQIRP